MVSVPLGSFGLWNWLRSECPLKTNTWSLLTLQIPGAGSLDIQFMFGNPTIYWSPPNSRKVSKNPLKGAMALQLHGSVFQVPAPDDLINAVKLRSGDLISACLFLLLIWVLIGIWNLYRKRAAIAVDEKDQNRCWAISCSGRGVW